MFVEAAEPIVGAPLLTTSTAPLLLRDRHGPIGFGGGRDQRQVRGPNRDVVAITGDGGFLMNGMEVSTAVHYDDQ